MDFWIVTGGGLLAGAVAWTLWRLRAVTRDVKQSTRRQYYSQRECRETARQSSDALVVLRSQLARMAAGHPLDAALIETGRLYHQMSADEAKQMVASPPPDLVVVDVRNQKEFQASHIPGATHIPFEQMETRISHDVPNAAAKILVYCAQGERSRLACDFLSQQGYLNVVNMHDGFQNWTGPVLGTGNLNLIHIQSK